MATAEKFKLNYNEILFYIVKSRQSKVYIAKSIMLSAATKSIDLQKLKAFVIEKALTCVHEPEGMLKFRHVTPTYEIVAGADDNAEIPARSKIGFYLQMYDWDACLFSQAQSYLGLSNLALDIVRNFLSLKLPDGYIPRTVSPHRVWDGADHCKPLLCQALLKEQKDDNFKTLLPPSMLEELDNYLSYFETHRQDKDFVLFHWRNMLESGVDDNLALIYPLVASKDENQDVHGYPDGRLLATDLNSWLVAEYKAFAELASKADKSEFTEKYELKARNLTDNIEKVLWNESLSLYCNFDPLTAKQNEMRIWTGFMPVALGIARADRAKQVIENCILNPEHFLRPSGVTTIAASESLYNQAKRGLYGRANVANWQGPVWFLPNYLAIKGMLKYGYEKEAKELSLRILTTLASGIEKAGTLNENYHADTGEPLWAPNFMSWTVLSLELIELLQA